MEDCGPGILAWRSELAEDDAGFQRQTVVLVSFLSLYQIPEDNQCKKTGGLFWLTVLEVPVYID
jgi:hypothetical protein